MLEMPDAAPTWSADTADVEADDAGPFDRPSPTPMAISGRTNAPYSQEDCTKASATKPIAPRRKPRPTARREPIFCASGVMNGVMAIIAAAAGSVARPASRAL